MRGGGGGGGGRGKKRKREKSIAFRVRIMNIKIFFGISIIYLNPRYRTEIRNVKFKSKRQKKCNKQTNQIKSNFF